MKNKLRRDRLRRARVRAPQAGFSLVELMVALTLSLLILVGLIVLFANQSAARTEIDKSSRQIENGRFAMQVLSDDIRHAGYFGALGTAPAVPSALPDPCSTTVADARLGIGIPLHGYVGAAAANAIAAGTLGCIDAAAGYKPYTAVLVVRRAGTGTPTASTSPTAGFFNIQASGCAGDANLYTLDVPTGTFNLHANGFPGCTPITAAPLATLLPVYTRIYFVSTCSQTDCSAGGADTVPTLKRIDVTPTGTLVTPIVDGIENIQFEYGLDALALFDGTPDTYTSTPPDATKDAGVPAPSTAGRTWENVMSVRVNVLARNLDLTAGYTDTKTYDLGASSVSPGGAFKRHAFREVVRLNNPAGRRE